MKFFVATATGAWASNLRKPTLGLHKCSDDSFRQFGSRYKAGEMKECPRSQQHSDTYDVHCSIRPTLGHDTKVDRDTRNFYDRYQLSFDQLCRDTPKFPRGGMGGGQSELCRLGVGVSWKML